MPIQQRNPELVDLLSSDFQPRYEPNFAWKSACSTFMALPALRAFWPMSSVDYIALSQCTDMAGTGNHLTNNNTVLFGYDQLIPYAEFDGVNQYLSRPDLGAGDWADITGLEAFIPAAQRGLTLGGWFYTDALAGSQTLISKHDGATVAGSAYSFQITGAGAVTGSTFLTPNTATVTSTNSIAALSWFFAVLRFIPSTSIDAFLNNVETNQAHVLASINDTAAQLDIGAIAAGISPLNGKASLCFLCAAALSDTIIGSLWHQTRALFNA